MGEPSISIVVPTLDEAARWPLLWESLRDVAWHEVIVADGGSTDGLADLVGASGATWIDAPRGRGPQLNAGAAVATGDVLWFLHADAMPPPGALGAIREALRRPDVVGGAFKLRTVADGPGVALGSWVRIANLRSRWTRLPYGDQGIFARRSAFEAVGGFPDQPILEDVGLSRRLWSEGRLVRLEPELRVSGRRFQDRPLYYLGAMHLFPRLHALGVPAATLARWYPPVRGDVVTRPSGRRP